MVNKPWEYYKANALYITKTLSGREVCIVGCKMGVDNQAEWAEWVGAIQENGYIETYWYRYDGLFEGEENDKNYPYHLAQPFPLSWEFFTRARKLGQKQQEIQSKLFAHLAAAEHSQKPLNAETVKMVLDLLAE